MTCAGSTTGEKCGGYDRMTVYNIGPNVGPVPSPADFDWYAHEGCFRDSRSRRIMSKRTDRDVMSAEVTNS